MKLPPLVLGPLSVYTTEIWAIETAGSGKWKGIQGSGTFKIVSQTKPHAGGLELCLQHPGTFTLPEKK